MWFYVIRRSVDTYTTCNVVLIIALLQPSLGVSRMTEVTIREQMTRMTSRAMAIPFQFLCGGLLPTSSCQTQAQTCNGLKQLKTFIFRILYILKK